MPKESEFYSPEKKKEDFKRIVVEVGPNIRPLVYKMEPSGKEISYEAGKEGEALFNLRSGDTFFEVDLPPRRSVDVFRENLKRKDIEKSHLVDLKVKLDERLPEGVRGEVLHADAQKLPFEDGKVDTLYMVNVLSGHVKDDKMLGFRADKKRILREKHGLINEAKRVLKVGGKLIIEEEFAPAVSVRGAYLKVLHELEHDPDFDVRVVEEWEKGYERFVLELTKREDLKEKP